MVNEDVRSRNQKQIFFSSPKKKKKKKKGEKGIWDEMLTNNGKRICSDVSMALARSENVWARLEVPDVRYLAKIARSLVYLENK